MSQPEQVYTSKSGWPFVAQPALLEEGVVRQIGCYAAQIDVATPDADGVLRISVTERPSSEKMLLKIVSFLKTGHLAPVAVTTDTVKTALEDLISLCEDSCKLKIPALQRAVVDHISESLHGDWLNQANNTSDEIRKALWCSVRLYKVSNTFKATDLRTMVLKQIEDFRALTAGPFIDVSSSYLDSIDDANADSLEQHFKYRLKQFLPSIGSFHQSYRDQLKKVAFKTFYVDLLEERLMEGVVDEERRAAASDKDVKVKREAVA